MPLENIEDCFNLSNWFKNACQGTEVHRNLDYLKNSFIKHSKDIEKFNPNDADIYKKLKEISTDIELPECDYLYAYAIEILKISAFLKMPDGTSFVSECYGIIKSIWNERYPIQKKPNVYLFDADRFLGGWIQGLQNINPEFLCHYVPILECKGLDGCPAFNQAVEELAKKIGDIIATDSNLDFAAKSGFALCKILKDFIQIKHDVKKTIEILPIACNLSIELAQHGKYSAIQKFEKTIDYLGKPKLIKNSLTPQKKSKDHFEAYEDIYGTLSKAFEQAKNDKQQELCDRISDLMPKLVINRNRNQRRKAPEDFSVKLNALVDGQLKTLTGTVENIDDETGHFCSIDFTDVNNCQTVKDSDELMQFGKKQFHTKALWIEEKNDAYCLGPVIAELSLPEVSKEKHLTTEEMIMYPIRGWKHKHSAEEEVGLCTAVFFAEKTIVSNHQNLVRLRPLESKTEQEDIKKKTKLVKVNSYAPFAKGSEGLFTGLLRWFKNLSVKIPCDKFWRSFWTGRKRVPIDEPAIDGKIRGLLSRYVKKRNGHLSPQEEASAGKLDYLVSRGGNDKVVVELKRSVDHNHCKHGISTQLPDYMKDKDAEYGIFVIFCFNGKYKKDSKRIQELCELRNKVCENNNIKIKIITINVDPPTKTTDKKQLNDSERYFEY